MSQNLIKFVRLINKLYAGIYFYVDVETQLTRVSWRAIYPANPAGEPHQSQIFDDIQYILHFQFL